MVNTLFNIYYSHQLYVISNLINLDSVNLIQCTDEHLGQVDYYLFTFYIHIILCLHNRNLTSHCMGSDCYFVPDIDCIVLLCFFSILHIISYNCMCTNVIYQPLLQDQGSLK